MSTQFSRSIKALREALNDKANGITRPPRIFFNEEDIKADTAPKVSGLYLIGSTHFNPITDEKFYLIKVGMSTNLNGRMSGYKTQNPLVFHIDYLTGKTDIEKKIINLWNNSTPS